MTRRVHELLFVELLGGIGDLLLALPAVHALARAHPQARLRVLTFDAAAPLLAHDPAVAEVVAVPKRHGGARRAVERELGRCRPDLAVSTTMYEGIAELLRDGAQRAVTNLWRSPPADELVDLRFLRLLAADGLIAPADVAEPLRLVLLPEERRDGAELLARLVGAVARPVVALLDAGMSVKRWPAEHWGALVASLTADGRVVLVPPGDDADVIRTAARAGAIVLPPLGLRELAALCAAVADAGGAAVGADTGPLRLAQAVGLPVVGLFGPTLGSRYGPRAGDGVALQGGPGCAVRRPLAISEQECWWSAVCPVSGADPACTRELEPARVAAVLAR